MRFLLYEYIRSDKGFVCYAVIKREVDKRERLMMARVQYIISSQSTPILPHKMTILCKGKAVPVYSIQL